MRGGRESSVVENMILTSFIFYFASTLPQVLTVNHTFDDDHILASEKCVKLQMWPLLKVHYTVRLWENAFL